MNYEESDIKVYVTKDYDIFKKLLQNRDARSEGKIIESIQAVGYVPVPITVNEKMEIIDGQNRVAALKDLGLPVYFEIQPGLGIEQCRSLNIGQTNWTTLDYVESYAKGGSSAYQRFNTLLTSYRKQLSLQGVYAMAKPAEINDGGAKPDQVLKKGSLKFSDEEYELAIKRIASAIDLGYVDLCKRKKFNARIYWSCVSYIYQDANVQAANVITKLLQYEAVIPPVNTVSEQLRFFDDAIGRGVRAKDKVYLQADFLKREWL